MAIPKGIYSNKGDIQIYNRHPHTKHTHTHTHTHITQQSHIPKSWSCRPCDIGFFPSMKQKKKDVQKAPHRTARAIQSVKLTF